MQQFPLRRAAVGAIATLALAVIVAAAPTPRSRAVPCDQDNAGLTLPPGFCATIFADNLEGPRHMMVASNGDLLVNVLPPRAGAEGNSAGGTRSLLLLRDVNGDGKADTVIRLGAGGGTGIWLANGSLYATSGRAILRYRYAAGATTLPAPDTILSEIATGGHSAYNFVVLGRTLYMNVGSATNICQTRNQPRVPGVDPCVELETRAGIWTFDAMKTGQKPADGQRFATGIRNSVSLTVNPRDNTLWATMHGRDNLAENWGFPAEYGAENPAEQVNHILKGDNFGWPYCYYSNEEHHLVTGPEYGGDGKKTDRCTDKKSPEYAFPGHWAPNDMLFYTGSKFPSEYKGGAFIVFHGSWNRAPGPQEGYRVVFLPIKGEKAGPHRDFAVGFSSHGNPGTDGRIHRPTGIAQAPDGSIYVSDDVAGTIYKISYKGT